MIIYTFIVSREHYLHNAYISFRQSTAVVRPMVKNGRKGPSTNIILITIDIKQWIIYLYDHRLQQQNQQIARP